MRTRKESEHERRLSRQLNVQVHNYIRETIISVKFDFGRKLNEFALHSLFPYQLRIWKVHFVLFMFFFLLKSLFFGFISMRGREGERRGGEEGGGEFGNPGRNLDNNPRNKNKHFKICVTCLARFAALRSNSPSYSVF